MGIIGLKIGELEPKNANSSENERKLRMISRLSNPAVSDFSEGNNDFPIIRINERFCPFKKLSGSFRSEHNQFKSVGYFLQAIFDRDPGHLVLL